MKNPVLTYEEFVKGSVPTDVLRLSEDDIKVLEEYAHESDLRRARDWNFLADRIVGAEY